MSQISAFASSSARLSATHRAFGPPPRNDFGRFIDTENPSLLIGDRSNTSINKSSTLIAAIEVGGIQSILESSSAS